MGRSDNNNRIYTLSVFEIDIQLVTDSGPPRVIIEHHGPISSRAKKQITEAIKSGNVSLREKKIWLA